MWWYAKLFILCTLPLILLQTPTPGHALVRRYKFELRNSLYTRLCTTKTMLTINGQFPGPTIYARRGDLIIVDVINRANHSITIHWHGVKMPRYPWSDGPAYVTQCPIRPGNRFRQRVILSDEEGTLWWHAHSEWSRNSVHGAIVILPPRTQTYPFPKPHAEVPIILGEWWNSDMQKVYEEVFFLGIEPQVSDAFLINGQPGDLFPCSKQDTYKLRVEYGKTYLIRMVNVVMDYVMFFRIVNHNLTVVGADGVYVKPVTSDYIAIAPGQTMDFLLEANQPPMRYYMAARVQADGGEFEKTPTTGYLEYEGNYTPPEFLALPAFPPFNSSEASQNFFKQLRSKYPIDIPKNVTVNLFYTLSMNLRPCPNASCLGPYGGRLLASMNNMSLVLSTIPFLEAYYYNISGVYETNFPDYPPFPFNYTQDNSPNLRAPEYGTAGKVLEFNSTVEVVFQATNLAYGVDHPMHLHGHSFYVVGSGFGNFNKDSDPANYNLVDPPLMNTIFVPRNGWAAIRFNANNPGVWYLHCHFERHVSWGMATVFIVKDGKGPSEKMLPPPPDMPRCGNSSTLYSSISVDSTTVVGEWWNSDMQKVYEEVFFLGIEPQVSDAFLINGQPGDLFPCSKQDTYKLRVEYGKTYLIRMVNVVMDYVMFFRIVNHNLTVVGADGVYVKPVTSDYIAIAPGQTMDFLLEANQPPMRYYMAARVQADGGEFEKTPTTGYLEYEGNYTPPEFLALPAFPPFNSSEASQNFFKQLRSKYPIDIPKNVTVNLFYTLSMNLRPCPNASCLGPYGGRLLASMNNMSLVLPTIPFLEAYYYNISGVYETNFPDYPPFPFNYTQDNSPNLRAPEYGTAGKVLEFNSTVEVVFQATNLAYGVDHPMHLHGHSFYVVGSGFGNFNKDSDPANYNLVDPPLMNTIFVPRNGWAAIRFNANNPGVWYLHCHFERHVSWGMATVFIVKDGKGPSEKMLPPPPDMPRCGNSSTLYSSISVDSTTVVGTF